jgi:adenosylcobinamide-phosphate synthase
LIALIMIAALGLDWCLGEPRRWHPLVGFGAYALRLEAWLHGGDSHNTSAARWRGLWAVLLAVGPPTLLCALLIELPWGAVPLQIAVLYLTIGHRSLREHALQVSEALNHADLAAARHRVGLIVSRDTGAMQPVEVARAAVESVLENGNDAVFGALFWFALVGAPGALLYRLVNTLDAMWGYRTPRYRYFGWAAARFDDALNYIPARLTALTYSLVGHVAGALRCWGNQAAQWESPNAGPVMAAGAGSLHVSLGGPAFYHGHWKPRPPLGQGPEPQAHDIVRALRLLARALVLWIAAAITADVLLP